MQDYLIFHPGNQRQQADAVCVVLSADGRREDQHCKIWVDKISPSRGKNEDPFVWTTPWLYSYCHATQLVRSKRGDEQFVKRGSRLFFCEHAAAQRGCLKIDTVFVVGDVHPWEEQGKTVPPKFSECMQNPDSLIWQRHFRHGIRDVEQKGHKGLFTYEACHDESKGSFLPMDQLGNQFELDARAVFGDEVDISDRVPVGRSSYPQKLAKNQADELYLKCRGAQLLAVRVK